MDYQSMSVVQLKALAKERKLSGVSGLKKADLIAAIISHEKNSKEDTKSSESKEAGTLKRTVKTVQNDKEKPVTAKEGNVKGRVSPDSDKSLNQLEDRTDNRSVRQTVQESGRRNQEQQRHNMVHSAPRNSEQWQGVEQSGSQPDYMQELDSGRMANGILEVMPDGFGFIRCENYLPGNNDVYVSPAIIRKFGLYTGDIIKGNIKAKTGNEKFSALLRVTAVNDYPPETAYNRTRFENLIPIFPDERIHLENENSNSVPMRIMDLLAPVGKGQRGMIVSPPKAGKTTLLKQIAKSVSRTYKDMVLIVLLIDERPEEVTDIRESIEGPNVEVIYSTFDELPEHHKRVSEMVLERAKRLVEHGKDVMILLDSITRLARAYNLTVAPSGRTLSGGLDPAALHMPKKFFGAARNMRNGGSLTILATALVETGSRMDDVVFEEFKGTGNMELVLDRSLSEKRIFPAIDVNRSGTRRDDLLLSPEEQKANFLMHREMNNGRTEDTVEEILRLFTKTKDNKEFVGLVMETLGKRRKR